MLGEREAGSGRGCSHVACRPRAANAALTNVSTYIDASVEVTCFLHRLALAWFKDIRKGHVIDGGIATAGLWKACGATIVLGAMAHCGLNSCGLIPSYSAALQPLGCFLRASCRRPARTPSRSKLIESPPQTCLAPHISATPHQCTSCRVFFATLLLYILL